MVPRVVLMIDDDPDSFDRVNRYLDADMYNLHYAEDPLQGVQLAKDLQPDLIILDIRMPEPDGYEVCKRLRANEATRHIPIVIYSVLGDNDDTYILGLNLGAQAVVKKGSLGRLGAALGRFDPKGEEVPCVRTFLCAGHELRVQGEADRVWLNGVEKMLRPKARQLLACLVANAGVLVSSWELVRALWQEEDQYGLGPGSVHRLVHDLRNEVEPDPATPVFIESIPRQGYRLFFEKRHEGPVGGQGQAALH